MTAHYVVRLDDACHTMEHDRWRRAEEILNQHGIRPIVAVVPDNRDPKLMCRPRDEFFWEAVRAWDRKGWAIAMHGHTHVMHAVDSVKLLLPYYGRSEFAGLSLEEQSAGIRSAWRLFLAEKVKPTIWVAPAHSFDATTLLALRMETSIDVVSDGIAWDTFTEGGFQWIPQQLWQFVERPFGLWTVCLHPSTMTDESLNLLERNVRRFRDRIVSVQELGRRPRRRTPLDMGYSAYFWWRWRRARRRSGR